MRPDLWGGCRMAYLVSRCKIVVAVGVAFAAALIALAVLTWPSSGARVGGDPGGRLMAKIARVVRVVPGFERGRIPWIAFPCDACHFPATYAIKVKPRWDSCDGMAGTFGWDPPVVQAGFRWTRGRQALVGLLDKRLGARGWVRAAEPSWASAGGNAIWVSAHGHAKEFAIASPITGKQWTAYVEAKPQGQLVKGC